MKLNPWRRWWLLAILWLAAGLRLYRLEFQSIWWDEGHSIFVAAQPLGRIPSLPAMDVHPPAYFALLHGWMALAGQSEYALRYLSVLFSLLTIPLLWRFAAALAPRSAAPWIAALLATLSPLYVAYAQEVRSYALLTFLTLACSYSLWLLISRTATTGRASIRLAAFYTLLAAASLYTHYFSLFLLFFHTLVWLAWVVIPMNRPVELRRRAGLWLATQLGLLLLFAPQLALALQQVRSYTNPNLAPPGLAEFVSRTWQAYTAGPAASPMPPSWGAVAVALALLFCYIWLFPAALRRLRFPMLHRFGRQSSSSLRRPFTAGSACFAVRHFSLLFLVGWLVVPLAAYFAVLHRQPSFEPRYMILVTPALLLLLAVGPVWWPARALRLKRAGLQLVLYAAPLLVFALGLYGYYTDTSSFKDDSAGVAAWLAAETTASDIVYVDVPHPFHYYAGRYGIAAPVRYLFVDIHTIAETLTREAAGRDRLYWVTWRGSDTDPRGVVPYLAQKYGRLLGSREFRGYHVSWFSLPDAGTVYSVPTHLPPINATFGDAIRIDGAAFGGFPPSGTAVPAGRSAWLAIHAALLRDTDITYKISARLRGPDGWLAAQVDKELLNDRHFRTAAWPVDDPALNQAINVYTLPVPADTPPGRYYLEVVLYNAQPPYASEGVSGAATTDGVAGLIGQIAVTP